MCKKSTTHSFKVLSRGVHESKEKYKPPGPGTSEDIPTVRGCRPTSLTEWALGYAGNFWRHIQGQPPLVTEAFEPSGVLTGAEQFLDSLATQNEIMWRNRSSSPLCALVDELLLQIMGHMPPDSLYMIRHTSVIFLGLFCDPVFRSFHGEIELKTGFLYFNEEVRKSDPEGVFFKIKHVLMPPAFCGDCHNAIQSGLRRRRFENLLYDGFICSGCLQWHPTLLFDEDERQKVDPRCIGRTGHISISASPDEHHPPWTWEDATTVQDLGPGRHICFFSDCHETPDGRPKLIADGAPFPPLRIQVQRHNLNEIAALDLQYGWDLPLLDIDQANPPSLGMLRATLSNLLPNALQKQKLCPHVSPEMLAQRIIEQGICKCFTSSVRTLAPDCNPALIQTHSCTCPNRRRCHECKICGAFDTIFLVDGRVMLTHRYSWDIWKPTSLGWLGLLDQSSYQGVFNEDSRHYLWCDNPGCHTGTGWRWLMEVKSYYATLRREGELPRDTPWYNDCRQMRQKMFRRNYARGQAIEDWFGALSLE